MSHFTVRGNLGHVGKHERVSRIVTTCRSRSPFWDLVRPSGLTLPNEIRISGNCNTLEKRGEQEKSKSTHFDHFLQ